YLENLGPERIRYAYAMRTFADMGIVAAASSDAPIVPPDPLLGIQTMVTRMDRHGDEVFPEEQISLEEAIRAFTVNSAFSAHAEHRKGRISPGQLADITVFDTDLRKIPTTDLAEQAVSYTIVDGQVVHDATA